MKLTIRSGPDAAGSPYVFDGETMRIGRGADCDWVLADPERHLSKHHCAIARAGGGYTITDTSSNGLFLNGAAQPLGRGASAPLGDGDVIALGGYEIVAEIQTGAAAGVDATIVGNPFASPGADADQTVVGAPPPPMAEPDFGAGAATAADDVFADEEFDQAALNPFVADDANPFAAALSPDAGVDQTQAGAGSSPASDDGDAGMIPEDFDVFGESPPAPQPDVTQRDDAPAEQAFFSPPRAEPAVEEQAIPDDWDLDEPKPPAPAPVTRAAPAPAAPAGGVAESQALRAFLRGAGLGELALDESQAGALLETAGQVFRELVGGLQDALAARAAAKSEMRVEQTMIGAMDNNVLKLAIGLEEALVALLRTPGRGFLAPVDSVRKGFNDLTAHQMATLAAMQAALRSALNLFDPSALERRLEQGSVFGGILPAARKARYWDLYREFYQQLAGEAREDFDGYFQREFAHAYEEQVRKFKT